MQGPKSKAGIRAVLGSGLAIAVLAAALASAGAETFEAGGDRISSLEVAEAPRPPSRDDPAPPIVAPEDVADAPRPVERDGELTFAALSPEATKPDDQDIDPDMPVMEGEIAAPRAPTADIRPILRPDRTAKVPHPRRRIPPSCTADGTHCIATFSYTRDVCRVIESVARENRLDPYFLVRLIWRESLFDPYAISHVGALGIAQFMPGTAEMRGLADPFNPAEALRASASYLRELTDNFGNIGLAAAAYNGGEGRVQRFLSGEGGMPMETRRYVYAITGYPVESWTADSPPTVDLTLEKDKGFEASCYTRAASRTWRDMGRPPDLAPWAMIFAAHHSRDLTERRSAWLLKRHGDIMDSSALKITHKTLPGRKNPVWIAQIGQQDREAASRMCNELRSEGTGCMVLRN